MTPVRHEFRLDENEYAALQRIAADNPPELLILGPSIFRYRQRERANAVWQHAAQRLGFTWDSAEPGKTGDPRDFTALLP